MARILFVTPYFPPEVGAPQARISETALRLVRRGHAVTILTTLPNYPKGTVFPGYERGQRRREDWNGVRVIRVWSYISPNKGFLRRILSQLSFGLTAPFLAAGKLGRPDVIIVESPPLFDAFAGRALSFLTRRPFIFIVSDIWPGSAVQLGVLRNKALIWLAERLEWSTYQRATLVWAVTEGIRKALVARGLPERKVFRLTNGVDTEKFKPIPRDEARAQLGWDDRYTVVYAGTVGLGQVLGIMLDAADALRDTPGLRFVLVGEGAAKDDLIAEARRRGLSQVEFLDAFPHAQIPTVLSAADALLVSMTKNPYFDNAIPSKVYEAMSVARPILLAANGEIRELVERQAQAAIHVEPENGRALADAILWLRQHPAEAQEMATHGRAFVKANFDRDLLADALVGHIYTAMGRRAPKIPPPAPQPAAPALPAEATATPIEARESMLEETQKRPAPQGMAQAGGKPNE
ncbi:MAG TPA: glycosyltransferase family 4 protein [Ktedonobacterales bacterium]